MKTFSRQVYTLSYCILPGPCSMWGEAVSKHCHPRKWLWGAACCFSITLSGAVLCSPKMYLLLLHQVSGCLARCLRMKRDNSRHFFSGQQAVVVMRSVVSIFFSVLSSVVTWRAIQTKWWSQLKKDSHQGYLHTTASWISVCITNFLCACVLKSLALMQQVHLMLNISMVLCSLQTRFYNLSLLFLQCTWTPGYNLLFYNQISFLCES